MRWPFAAAAQLLQSKTMMQDEARNTRPERRSDARKLRSDALLTLRIHRSSGASCSRTAAELAGIVFTAREM